MKVARRMTVTFKAVKTGAGICQFKPVAAALRQGHFLSQTLTYGEWVIRNHLAIRHLASQRLLTRQSCRLNVLRERMANVPFWPTADS
ncbi:hypothetical protein OKW35_003112 [Paraburkholderia sp. MM5477-R1]|uniref:Uncharacterized protein n=1 Tax=Paraburkholderia tuberum TaxID=157910 RepID=A0A1H1KGM1_9BURK|nr:hypothetical protein SAMN05445850_7629 [Paraburkholderia tuberum]